MSVECECGRVLEEGSPTLRVKACKYCSGGWWQVGSTLDIGVEHKIFTRNLVVLFQEERLKLGSIDNIEL